MLSAKDVLKGDIMEEEFENMESGENLEPETVENVSRRNFLKGAAVIGTVAAAGGVLTACSTSSSGSGTSTGKLAADGTYTETTRGRNGLLTTVTTITNGAIAKVEVIDHQETEVFTSKAIPQICQNIVSANSYGIDVVAGATFTCTAIKTCVSKAITEAGGSDSIYNKPTVYTNVVDETINVDVAVVGAGLSGTTCACRAASMGATVALIDKTIVGGSALISSGGTIVASDAVTSTLTTWLSGQMYLADPLLVYNYLSNSAAGFAWIRSLKTTTELFSATGTLPAYMSRPTAYQEMLDNTVLKNNGKVYLATTAKSLITNSSGAVTGVIAKKQNGATLTVNAKAVVMSTGGYGGDAAKVKKLTGYNVMTGCLTQNIGEGMAMTQTVGAKYPITLGGLMLHQTQATALLTGYPYFQQQMPLILGYIPTFLNLDPNGRRFRNEDWVSTPTATAAGGAMAGGITYVLLDDDKVKKLTSGGVAAIGYNKSPGLPPAQKPSFQIDTPWDNFQQVLNDTVKGGWAYSGATIAELAKNSGMTPETLQGTIDTYNGYCKAGKDLVFDKTAANLISYGSGPYYLIQITYNHLGTIGGIVTNDQFQAVDEKGKAIAGLYATGVEAYGTSWNRNYYGSGHGIGFAAVSGYVTGGIVGNYVKAK